MVSRPLPSPGGGGVSAFGAVSKSHDVSSGCRGAPVDFVGLGGVSTSAMETMGSVHRQRRSPQRTLHLDLDGMGRTLPLAGPEKSAGLDIIDRGFGGLRRGSEVGHS